MSFVTPSYLWAFLGLLIPLAIHFWNNKEGKIIKVGSVQFLETSEATKSKSSKLNEYLLLFLRILLLGVLVLILAQPQIEKIPKNVPLTYLVEPNLLENKAVKLIIDSVKTPNEVRIFTTNFPKINRFNFNRKPVHTNNYWQLATETKSLTTDSIVVFIKGKNTRIKGKRPNVNIPIKWVVVENEINKKEKPIIAFKKENNFDIVSAKSTLKRLTFQKESLPLNSKRIRTSLKGDSLSINLITIPLKTQPKRSVLISYDNKFKNQLFYFEASIKAIERFTKQPITLEKTQQPDKLDVDKYSLIVWLQEEPPPQTRAKILQYKKDNLALNIIDESKIRGIYNLTELLTTQKIIETNFSNQLLQLFQINHIDNAIIDQLDKRILSDEEIQTTFKKKESIKKELKTVHSSLWLWIPFLVLVIIERIFAKYRKQ